MHIIGHYINITLQPDEPHLPNAAGRNGYISILFETDANADSGQSTRAIAMLDIRAQRWIQAEPKICNDKRNQQWITTADGNFLYFGELVNVRPSWTDDDVLPASSTDTRDKAP